jgi:hypothetical protein
VSQAFFKPIVFCHRFAPGLSYNENIDKIYTHLHKMNCSAGGFINEEEDLISVVLVLISASSCWVPMLSTSSTTHAKHPDGQLL